MRTRIARTHCSGAVAHQPDLFPQTNSDRALERFQPARSHTSASEPGSPLSRLSRIPRLQASSETFSACPSWGLCGSISRCVVAREPGCVATRAAVRSLKAVAVAFDNRGMLAKRSRFVRWVAVRVVPNTPLQRSWAALGSRAGGRCDPRFGSAFLRRGVRAAEGAGFENQCAR